MEWLMRKINILHPTFRMLFVLFAVSPIQLRHEYSSNWFCILASMNWANAISIWRTHRRNSIWIPTATAISIILSFVRRSQLKHTKCEFEFDLVVQVAFHWNSLKSALQNIGITIFSKLFFKSSARFRTLEQKGEIGLIMVIMEGNDSSLTSDAKCHSPNKSNATSA